MKRTTTFAVFVVFCQTLISCEVYPYLKEEVVKLVDYVNQLHWVDISSPAFTTGDAKVKTVKKRSELVLLASSAVSYEVPDGQHFAIVKSSCRPNADLRIAFQTVVQLPLSPATGSPLSFVSCVNSTWLFNVSSTKDADTVKFLVLRNDGSDEILIQKLGVGTSNIEKTLGVVHESGRQRLEALKSFLDPQVIVSVLGLRGSGKSTIASLLSGNDEMFKAGRRSKGTTTLGIDMSPIIPISDYIPCISTKLSKNFTVGGVGSTPILFTDSEGMGVRGEDIDFVASVPPLLLSNIVMWITTDSLRIDEELKKLDKYLNLANKIRDESGTLCSDFRAGHLVVVVNKMQGAEADEELTEELLEEEEDITSDSGSFRNSVRQNLMLCFQSVQVIGFPYLNIPDDKSYIKYKDISGSKATRFLESLAKIVNLTVRAKDERRVLAGTVLTPKEIPTILDAALEKINSGAEFLDSELRDMLFLISIKEKLNEYELAAVNRVLDVERQENIDLFVMVISQIFQVHDIYRASLVANVTNPRHLKLVEKEWTVVEDRMLTVIRKSVTSLVSSIVKGALSPLTSFASTCAYTSYHTHRCIRDNFFSKLRETLKLPKELVEDSVALIDNPVNTGVETLGDCVLARGSFMYSELSKTSDLAGVGVLLEEKLESGSSVDEIWAVFEKMKIFLFPGTPLPRESHSYCDPRMDERRPVYSLSSALSASLEVARKRFVFYRRLRPVDVAFDFLNDIEKAVTVGSARRVVDSTCDLPSIMAGVPHEVTELYLFCLRTVAYGHVSTHLKVLRIDTVRLEVNPNGATVRLVETPSPGKAPHHTPGAAGGNAGSVYVKVRSLVTGGVLEVKADGGEGGAGGDGVQGGQGVPGPDGSFPGHLSSKSHYDSMGNGALSQVGYQEHECKKRGRWWKKKKSYTCGRTWTYSQYFVHHSAGSGPGAQGQPGTNGAPGGPGGKPGMMTVEVDRASHKNFKLSAVGGRGGPGGHGGTGGPGGIGGVSKVMEVRYSRVWQWWENQGERMISSDMNLDIKNGGREANGPQGHRGEEGPQGASGGPPNAILFSTVHHDLSLFHYLEQLPSAEAPENKCGLYFDGRNVSASTSFISNNIEMLLQQKTMIARARALYGQHSAAASIQTHLGSQIEWVSRLIQIYTAYKERLQQVMNFHVNVLTVTEKELSNFNMRHFEGLIDRINEEFSTKIKRNDVIKEKLLEHPLADAFSRVLTVLNLAVGFFGSSTADPQNGIKGVFRAAKSFWESVEKFPDHKKVTVSSPPYDFELFQKGCNSFSYDHVAFANYIVLGNTITTENLRDSLQTFVNSLTPCSMKEQIMLSLKLSDLLKAHTAKAVYDGALTPHKRKESHQVLSHIRAGILKISDKTAGGSLQDILSRLESQVYNAKRLAAVVKDIARVDRMMQIFTQRKGAFEAIHNDPAINSPFPTGVVDQLVIHAVYCLLDIGGELRWRIFDLAGVVSCSNPNSKVFEVLPNIAPWSAPASFSDSLVILLKELELLVANEERNMLFVLDEIEFPLEFDQLRKAGRATFPVYLSDRKDLFVKDIRVMPTDASGTVKPGTVFVRHSGVRLYEFDDDINLPSVTFQSTYRLPGPTREETPVPNFGNRLPSYSLDSYYEIEVPKSNDLVFSEIVQIQLQFTVRSQPNS